jgi:hypothetical protein
MAEQSIGGLYRLKNFAERHVAEGWTLPALRWLIFQRDRELTDAGVVRRLGARVFIDEAKFVEWLKRVA